MLEISGFPLLIQKYRCDSSIGIFASQRLLDRAVFQYLDSNQRVIPPHMTGVVPNIPPVL